MIQNNLAFSIKKPHLKAIQPVQQILLNKAVVISNSSKVRKKPNLTNQR